jgi:hypothetical protein
MEVRIAMPILDLSSLQHALAALDRGLARALPAPADEELRDACIQRRALLEDAQTPP